MVANTKANMPNHLLTVERPSSLQAKIAPTIVIPEMALDPDIRGVCKVGGTLLINSKPKKLASARM